MDKALLFLILGLGAFWLVLDNFYGKGYINNAVSKVLS